MTNYVRVCVTIDMNGINLDLFALYVHKDNAAEQQIFCA